jgi:hypothetical protein
MEYAVIWIMSQRILLHLRGSYLTTLRHGLFTESVSAEARARQTSLIVEQIPRANPISSPHKSTYRNRPDGNVDVGNNCDTALSDFNVQVRIDRTIIRDEKPLDEETTAERALYTPPPKSDWDGSHGSDV